VWVCSENSFKSRKLKSPAKEKAALFNLVPKGGLEVPLVPPGTSLYPRVFAFGHSPEWPLPRAARRKNAVRVPPSDAKLKSPAKEKAALFNLVPKGGLEVPLVPPGTSLYPRVFAFGHSPEWPLPRAARRKNAVRVPPSDAKLKSPAKEKAALFNLVPKGGLEPPQAFTHKNLNLARLPIPPLRH